MKNAVKIIMALAALSALVVVGSTGMFWVLEWLSWLFGFDPVREWRDEFKGMALAGQLVVLGCFGAAIYRVIQEAVDTARYKNRSEVLRAQLGACERDNERLRAELRETQRVIRELRTELDTSLRNPCPPGSLVPYNWKQPW